jgi:hypothetical protein
MNFQKVDAFSSPVVHTQFMTTSVPGSTTYCDGSGRLDNYAPGAVDGSAPFRDDGTPTRVRCHCACGFKGVGVVIRADHGYRFSTPMVRIPRHPKGGK